MAEGSGPTRRHTQPWGHDPITSIQTLPSTGWVWGGGGVGVQELFGIRGGRHAAPRPSMWPHAPRAAGTISVVVESGLWAGPHGRR